MTHSYWKHRRASTFTFAVLQQWQSSPKILNCFSLRLRAERVEHRDNPLQSNMFAVITSPPPLEKTGYLLLYHKLAKLIVMYTYIYIHISSIFEY